MKTRTSQVLLYGAYGHTAKFVIESLLAAGFEPILAGRSEPKMDEIKLTYPNLRAVVGSVSDMEIELRHNIALVVNCAGPFVDTAHALVEICMTTGTHYLDIAAEQAAVLSVYHQFSTSAVDRGITVVPASGFFGGLGDLLTARLIREIRVPIKNLTIAAALSDWHPTAGTRLTGDRNPGARWSVYDGRLQQHRSSEPFDWTFPAPIGTQRVYEVPLAETLLVSRYVSADRISAVITANTIDDLGDESTPPPRPVDVDGRSGQKFTLQVTVETVSGDLLSSWVSGQDIYAITGPIVAHTATALLAGSPRYGVRAVSEIVDPDDVLRSLPLSHVEIGSTARSVQ